MGVFVTWTFFNESQFRNRQRAKSPWASVPGSRARYMQCCCLIDMKAMSVCLAILSSLTLVDCFIINPSSNNVAQESPNLTRLPSHSSCQSRCQSRSIDLAFQLYSALSGNQKSLMFGEEQSSWSSSGEQGDPQQSQVRYIRSSNLAGFVGKEGEDIIFRFDDERQRLVVVTGETGAGKSLLLRRTMELLCGGRVSSGFVAMGPSKNPASSSLDQTTTVVSVEMELLLREPHLSATLSAFQRLGLDSSTMFAGGRETNDNVGLLRIERQLQFQQSPTSTSSSKTAATTTKPRLKSLCKVNNQQVTLKVLEALASPLLAIVDAATASQALAKPEARLSMLDTAVSSECLTRVHGAKLRYRSCREKREKLQRELESRVLPVSFSRNSTEDVELLMHWVEELDSFEKRVVSFCASLVSPGLSSKSNLAVLGRELASTVWMDSCAPPGKQFSSAMLERLTCFRNFVTSLEKRLEAARRALELIGSLSFKQSAITAVEKARELLVDASGGEVGVGKLSSAAEQAHDLLTVVEESISEFVGCVDDEDRGLIRILEEELSSCAVSKEDIDATLQEWGTLSRKHGIAAALLPSCHEALKTELSGNMKALSLLPKALAEEETALIDFEEACSELSQERLLVADRLSGTATSMLPSLGMDHAIFHARVNNKARKCTDASVYSVVGNIGLDSVDFVLDQTVESATNGQHQGPVHVVASSGEKARLLLSIECTLPGSVGAACGTIVPTSESLTLLRSVSPVVVLYDEIDAHVGGHAAVSLARMLVHQSVSSQVIAITHNPSVAASGDLHLVVKRETHDTQNGRSIAVSVDSIEGHERRRELARMASGDLAAKEAEIFAEALIRDGSIRRNRKY